MVCSLFLSNSSTATTISSPLVFSHKLCQRENPKKGIYLYTPISRSPKIGLTSIKCNIPKFPRMNVWDPYKRLGISPYASEEEIWSSRNFLLQQYAGNETSEESIEAAFEKLLMTSYRERKKTKINLKTRLKKKVEESPPWVKNLLNFVELPPVEKIVPLAFMCYMNSAEGGPAFQVAVSLAACIYFLNEKTKSLGRAFIIGLGALAAGWVCGSICVPIIPTVIIPPTWTLELMTSLVSYIFLFLGCTFLK
uniref:Protein CHAPERONE-LIKE PROTEIN OF POR1, chloroplastic n=1 Tax=Salix viminalis TaxID=40686 RepID=A0A6N2N552_SALVM